MTPQKLMTSRVNTVFLIMLLTVAVQSVITLPTMAMEVISQFVDLSFAEYYTGFVLPQLLYPIGTCVLALLALKLIRIPADRFVTFRPLKADFIPWLGVFMGVSVVMNYLVTGLLWLLEQIGLPASGAFDSFDPQDFPQAVCYFVILAILPPVCEEVLCRAAGTGVLKNFNPWAAVFLSAYAFGMMHGTIQQIPFAFALGIILGMVYIKTGNLLYPILFHFVNNAWACVLTYLSVWAGESVLNWVGYGSDILFLLFGIASLIWLLVKKQFTLKEIPHSLTAGQAFGAVIKAPTFWIFSGVYGGLTLIVWLSEILLNYFEIPGL